MEKVQSFAGFSGLLVLHCHGDLPLGVVRFSELQRYCTQCRNKSSKQDQHFAVLSCFYKGFRSYVGDFLVALLKLVRPSLPWGFAAGNGSFFEVAAVLDTRRSSKSAPKKPLT